MLILGMSRKVKIGKKVLKIRNPIASSLSMPEFKNKIVRSKKVYNRKKLKIQRLSED